MLGTSREMLGWSREVLVSRIRGGRSREVRFVGLGKILCSEMLGRSREKRSEEIRRSREVLGSRLRQGRSREVLGSRLRQGRSSDDP